MAETICVCFQDFGSYYYEYDYDNAMYSDKTIVIPIISLTHFKHQQRQPKKPTTNVQYESGKVQVVHRFLFKKFSYQQWDTPCKIPVKRLGQYEPVAVCYVTLQGDRTIDTFKFSGSTLTIFADSRTVVPPPPYKGRVNKSHLISYFDKKFPTQSLKTMYIYFSYYEQLYLRNADRVIDTIIPLAVAFVTDNNVAFYISLKDLRDEFPHMLFMTMYNAHKTNCDNNGLRVLAVDCEPIVSQTSGARYYGDKPARVDKKLADQVATSYPRFNEQDIKLIQHQKVQVVD